jgi:phosphatidylglycerol:prolipoprotein diacylglycerol transferase
MHPILVKIGPFSIYSYGMMIALGFSLAAYLMYTRAREFGLTGDNVVDMLVLVLIGGLIGARLLYVALHPAYYAARPIEILDFSKGGLVWYGGFLSGLLAFFLYAHFKKLRFWDVGDFIVPYVALAQSLGRIGCFLNGCCFGSAAPASFPLGVAFPDITGLRHPTQLYSSLALLGIFVILRFLQDRRHFAGEVFLLYCVLYSAKRFLMEFLRGDNPHLLFGLTLSQAISVLVLSASLMLLFYKAALWKRSSTSSK